MGTHALPEPDVTTAITSESVLSRYVAGAQAVDGIEPEQAQENFEAWRVSIRDRALRDAGDALLELSRQRMSDTVAGDHDAFQECQTLHRAYMVIREL